MKKIINEKAKLDDSKAKPVAKSTRESTVLKSIRGAESGRITSQKNKLPKQPGE